MPALGLLANCTGRCHQQKQRSRNIETHGLLLGETRCGSDVAFVGNERRWNVYRKTARLKLAFRFCYEIRTRGKITSGAGGIPQTPDSSPMIRRSVNLRLWVPHP